MRATRPERHPRGKLPSLVLPLLAAVIVLGCAEEPPREATVQDPETGRWYSVEQVMRGGEIYSQYCAGCHGEQAEGAENWFRRQSDGRWPPPPLNGTGHAWHHPLWQLRQQIAQGSDPRRGDMPAFAGVLSDSEIDSVIAWFQSHWRPEVYSAWLVYDANTPVDPDS
jgi:mono/diheme cytochrome c family protein